MASPVPGVPPVRRLRLSEIAASIGVAPATVSNWRKRHQSFPAPESRGGQEYFSGNEVVSWLSRRSVPSKQLRTGESEETTYGDRLRHALTKRDSAPKPRDDGEGDAAYVLALKRLWQGRFRAGGLGEVAFVDAALLLVFTWICSPDVWHAIEREVAGRAGTGRGKAGGLLGSIAGLVDAMLREHGLVPAAGPVLAPLERVDIEDVRNLIADCARLGVRGFDGLLGWYAAKAATRSDNYCTPPSVAALLAGCAVAPKTKTASIAEPYIRFGELVLALPEDLTADSLTVAGTCSDEAAAQRASMNLIVHGKPGVVRVGDTRPWRHRWPEKFDSVVANPAFNVGSNLVPPDERWRFGSPPPHNDNLAWVQSLLEITNEHGRAAILLPASAGGSSHRAEVEIRTAMVEQGAVCAVIRLPAEVFPVSAVDTAIWVLRRPDRSERRPILFVDADPMVERQPRRRPELRHVEEILELVRAPEKIAGEGIHRLPSNGRARLVPAGEVASTGYVLISGNYLQPMGEHADAYRSRIASQQSALDALNPRSVLEAWPRVEVCEKKASESGTPEGWKRRRLSDLCTIQPGPSPSYLELKVVANGTVPVIAPKNVGRRRIDTANLGKVSEAARGRLSKFLTRENDLLAVRSGKVGEFAIVGPDQCGWLVNSNVTLIRVNDVSIIDPEFLLEYLTRDNSTTQVRERAKVNAVPSISADALGRLEIMVPPIEEQCEMVGLLKPMYTELDRLHRVVSAMEGLRTVLSGGLLEGVVEVGDVVI